jgi:hypothetical protein
MCGMRASLGLQVRRGQGKHEGVPAMFVGVRAGSKTPWEQQQEGESVAPGGTILLCCAFVRNECFSDPQGDDD